MKHLLSIAEVPDQDLTALLLRADHFRSNENLPLEGHRPLAGHTVVNLFFEPSTRTRLSFEIAAKRLGADVANVSGGATTSVSKGESLQDTGATIAAMGVSALVVRHARAGAADILARSVPCSVINAGDGAHEHPTQTLLDALTIRRAKGRVEGLRIAIVGDILHSRVARSNIALLNRLGAHVVVAGPDSLIPSAVEALGAARAQGLRAALEGADVVMALRIQHERMSEGFIPNAGDYSRAFGIGEAEFALAKPDAILMHPGPTNWGVELAQSLAQHPRSMVREQVSCGVAVRMAVLEHLVGGAR